MSKMKSAKRVPLYTEELKREMISVLTGPEIIKLNKLMGNNSPKTGHAHWIKTKGVSKHDATIPGFIQQILSERAEAEKEKMQAIVGAVLRMPGAREIAQEMLAA